MGCKVRRLPSGRLALSLQWVVDGKSVRSQEALGVSDTRKNREIIARDFVAPILAEIRARRFTAERYLEWFPHGSKAVQFRRALRLEPVGDIQPLPRTVSEWAAEWIERQKPPFRRASYYRDCRQHMTAYVLPGLGDVPIGRLSLGDLHALREALAHRERPLAMKTIRSVIDGTFHACVRDARAAGLIGHDPFDGLRWPRLQRQPPDPFTADEQERILEHFRTVAHGFYYPYVLTQFVTGMRPSEAVALDCGDLDVLGMRLHVWRSRNLGHTEAPKTAKSDRVIALPASVVDTLSPLTEGRPLDGPLFRNLDGNRLKQDNFRKSFWAAALRDLGIRHRVFYATRHTCISLMLTRGAPIMGVAQYCGTSPQVIEQSYGRWIPSDPRQILEYVSEGGRKRDDDRDVAVGIANSARKTERPRRDLKKRQGSQPSTTLARGKSTRATALGRAKASGG